MTDTELDAEREALGLEHAELQAEHARLEHDPQDVPGHVEHSRKLRAHVERLRAFREAVLARQRSRELS
jgi:hypothetical protein